MSWDEIMKIQNPHKALELIEQKVKDENLSFLVMVDKIEQYENMHGVTGDEMAFYPNGERVIR